MTRHQTRVDLVDPAKTFAREPFAKCPGIQRTCSIARPHERSGEDYPNQLEVMRKRKTRNEVSVPCGRPLDGRFIVRTLKGPRLQVVFGPVGHILQEAHAILHYSGP